MLDVWMYTGIYMSSTYDKYMYDKIQVSGSAKLVTPTNNKAALMAAIAVAPTTVYFDVENSFMSYSGGVSYKYILNLATASF